MRNPRKKSSEPLVHPIVVIPSRADGEGPYISCLITQSHPRAPQRDCEVLRFAQHDSAIYFAPHH